VDGVDSDLEARAVTYIADLAPGGRVVLHRGGGNRDDRTIVVSVPKTAGAEHAVELGLFRALEDLGNRKVQAERLAQPQVAAPTSVMITRRIKRMLGLIPALLLLAGSASAQSAFTPIPKVVFANLGTPADGMVWFCTDCTAGSTPCTGASTGALAIRQGAAWTCVDKTAAGGAGAPTDAQYWTGAADVTLTAEKNLGALGTGLVINTAGVPSAYAGTSCTNQFPRSLNASGAATCATVSLVNDITGTLVVGNGGTGQASAGSSGQYLKSDGTIFAPAAVPAFYMEIAAGAQAGHSPADSTTYYFASPLTVNPGTVEAQAGLVVPVNCTIRRADIFIFVLGTLGSSENATITVRNTTAGSDLTLSSTAQFTAVSNKTPVTGLSTTYTAGDEIKVKLVTPAWVTNPTIVFYQVSLYFDVP
jgi:hypothetical protein